MKHSPLIKTLLAACLATAICGVTAAQEANPRQVFQERERLLELFSEQGADAIPDLIGELENENAMLRRTAAHLLVRLGEPAMEGIEAGLENDDFQVRRIMIDALSEMDRLDQYWAVILMDPHPSIRRDVQLIYLERHPLPEDEVFEEVMGQFTKAFLEAPMARRENIVELISTFDVINPQIRRLLILAANDEEPRIRETAYESILENITEEWDQAAELLAAAEADDHQPVRDLGLQMRWQLLQIMEQPLPKEGWRFITDPGDEGRDGEWYAVDFDDSAWRDDVPIAANWQLFMERRYDGPAWYRRTIEVDEFPEEGDLVYLDVLGVDEEGWVWINGEFAGAHELGTAGWNIPFQLDVTDLIKPGEPNQITVRVRNTAGQGGIWQPIYIRVLDTSALD